MAVQKKISRKAKASSLELGHPPAERAGVLAVDDVPEAPKPKREMVEINGLCLMIGPKQRNRALCPVGGKHVANLSEAGWKQPHELSPAELRKVYPDLKLGPRAGAELLAISVLKHALGR